MHDTWTNADLVALLGSPAVTRRQILVTSLAAGFALAVQPVRAETITTDTEGLTAGEVRVPVADGEIPAYRAMPATGGKFPIVLVVQEIFGVHEHIATCAGASPRPVISPWRPSCTRARATCRR